MKKPYSFNKMSNALCSCGCGRKIKLNVADRKENVNLLAYPCYRKKEEEKGNKIVTASESRKLNNK